MPLPLLSMPARPLALAAALLAAVASPAAADDGVIEINQAAVLAGIPSIGDNNPGFPLVIDRAGSYRLTSNLNLQGVPAQMIRIDADDVTLDLNGFVVGSCIDATGLCLAPVDPVDGIFSQASRGIVVRNGMVSRVSGLGVRLFERGRVENVIVRGVSLSGILVSSDSVVRNCTVTNSGATGNAAGISAGVNSLVAGNNVSVNGADVGISARGGSTVEGNVVVENAGVGIRVFEAGILVRGNTVRNNGGVGMDCGGAVGSTVGYAENVFVDNDASGEPQVSGSACVNVGGNLCKSSVNATCP
jgi:parallel beta-helix repeat protein